MENFEEYLKSIFSDDITNFNTSEISNEELVLISQSFVKRMVNLIQLTEYEQLVFDKVNAELANRGING